MKLLQNQQFTMANGYISPQAIELEEAVIGAILLDSRALEVVLPILNDEMFYDSSFGEIYKTAIELERENSPIDLLTVVERLKKNGKIDVVGGAFFVVKITEKVMSSANIENHAYIVKEKFVERKIIELSGNAIKNIYSQEFDGFEVLENLESDLNKLVEDFSGASNSNHISEACRKSSENLAKRIEMARTNHFSGINTGLHDLNRITGGWQNGKLIILAGRPAMGKTAMLLHFAKSAALNNSKPISACVFSLEMDEISLADRLKLSECEVQAERFKLGYLTNEEINQLEEASRKISQLNIYVDDKASVTMNYIRQKAKLMKKKGKCDIIFIDYLQLANESNEKKNRNREQEISQMSRQAKIMAKDLGLPVVLLSQLSREVEKRADKKPMLSDLRESGAIEQDADMVIFIYRPAYYRMVNPDNSFVENNFGELVIAKNRDGAVCTVKFGHNESLTKIFDYQTDTWMPNVPNSEQF